MGFYIIHSARTRGGLASYRLVFIDRIKSESVNIELMEDDLIELKRHVDYLVEHKDDEW